MLTNEQLEDLAAIYIAPQIDAGQTLDLMPLLRAVEGAAAWAEREACKRVCRDYALRLDTISPRDWGDAAEAAGDCADEIAFRPNV